MTHSIHDFDYTLPKEYIAQTPATPRESAKLMLLNRVNGTITHSHIKNFPEQIKSGDVVVVNNTKVFHARLHGMISSTLVEIFLVKPITENTWLALGKPGKKILVGSTIRIADNFTASIEAKNDDGTVIIRFPYEVNKIIAMANIYGDIPIPPYIKTMPSSDEYQTVYAKRVGSVAAPTAGFHITKTILTRLKQKGVIIVEITLHVGLGTFLPVKTQTLEEHHMHSEWAEVSPHAVETINQAKKEGRRIIAIGTTTLRTLEGVAAINNGSLKAFSGDIDIFITPGFKFHIADAMLTNFHLPKSTLVVLVSAFATREHILLAYRQAVERKYRFYSFGDAMFIY
jgi:S-adenosylmethionine:tRNA ribosyltransferase-isomerase